MDNSNSYSTLYNKMETILYSLSKYYEKQNNDIANSIIVNSKYYIKEFIPDDRYGYGNEDLYDVFLSLPAIIYDQIIDKRRSYSELIRTDIQEFNNIHNVYISNVYLEIDEIDKNTDWRTNSKALLPSNRVSVIKPSDNELEKIWIPQYFRLFISHKVENKGLASEIKSELEIHGISCFVAHEDIEPTREWQKEIEKALFSMDAMLTILTPNFQNSNWTDQEIGVAIGRGIQIVPISYGLDPYGFFGKIQSMKGVDNSYLMASKIYDLLWENSLNRELLIEKTLFNFEHARSFDSANRLMKKLMLIKNTTPDIIDRLENARKNNNQVSHANEVINHLDNLINRLRLEPR